MTTSTHVTAPSPKASATCCKALRAPISGRAAVAAMDGTGNSYQPSRGAGHPWVGAPPVCLGHKAVQAAEPLTVGSQVMGLCAAASRMRSTVVV